SRNPHCEREKALSKQYRQSIRATLPEAIKRTENAAACQKLAELRRMLGGGRAISRDNFYGYARCLEFQLYKI
ncbi:TPA: hypothetical protein ACQUHZ_001242, partial [Neisseria cinerea]